jgi:hypothetical protein
MVAGMIESSPWLSCDVAMRAPRCKPRAFAKPLPPAYGRPRYGDLVHHH